MIHFRGGEIQQKGKGIGGFFRGLINMLRPVARSVGSSLKRAATSNTAKDMAKTLGEQAIDSTLNMTKDYLNGNDMKHSFDRETGEFRKRGSEIITGDYGVLDTNKNSYKVSSNNSNKVKVIISNTK